MKIEVVPINFNCCGMPFLTTGNLDRFEEQAIENIKKLPQDFDYFITDCASCQWAWKQYIKYINNENLKPNFIKKVFESQVDKEFLDLKDFENNIKVKLAEKYAIVS